MENKTCSTNRARTLDYGQTWICEDSLFPKCPGGDVIRCNPNARQIETNDSVKLFGQDFCCKGWACIDLGYRSYKLDKEAWSWYCAENGMGDIKMIFNGNTWISSSDTCPKDKIKWDDRRKRSYCEADVDCHTDFLAWNDNIKNWECPNEDRNKTSVESKLEALISKVNKLEELNNIMDQKLNNLIRKTQ